MIPFSYILFSFVLDNNSIPLDNIKKIKEYNLDQVKEQFGIDYDFDKFIIFNVVQSLIFKEKIDRENETEQTMKIIDSKIEKEVDNFLKGQVKHIYSSEYYIENQKQIKKELDIISSELVNKIIYSKSLSEFNELMKNGITKGYLTHKITNESSKGYIELKHKLLNDQVNILLRYEKLRAILSGKNENKEELWNNGNPIRNHRKDYQIFIQKNKPELWDEIAKESLEHKYREKENRQGHSNLKKSYFALGYDTLQDFYELSKKEDVTEYKKIHCNCCGLGDPEKSLKNLKKMLRKKKRKEFRQNKKKSTNSEDKKEEEEKEKINKRSVRYRRKRGIKKEKDKNRKENKKENPTFIRKRNRERREDSAIYEKKRKDD